MAIRKELRHQLEIEGKKALRKEKGIQGKNSNYSMETWGYDEEIKYAYKDKDITTKEAKEVLEQLKEWNKPTPRLKGLGKDETTGKYSSYVRKDLIDETTSLINEGNAYTIALSKALSGTNKLQVNIRKGKFVKNVVQPVDSVNDFKKFILEQGMGSVPYFLVDSSGHSLGGQSYFSQAQRQVLKDLGYFKKITSEEDLLKVKNNAVMRSEELRNIRTNKIKQNYLKGLENKFGNTISDKVKEAIDELTTAEFLFLFYTTEALTFDFMYEERQLDARIDAIKSTIEAFKTGKLVGFDNFKEKMKDYIGD